MYAKLVGNPNSLAIMDRYDGYGDDYDTVYETLVIINFTVVGNFWVDLVIERRSLKKYVGEITFSQLKSGKGEKYNDFYSYMEKALSKADKSKYLDKDKAFKFVNPYLFRAQNNSNRIISGWIWDHEDLICEGDEYGNTNEYAIVGVYMHSSSDTKRNDRFVSKGY